MNEFSNKNFINPNDINVDLDIINGKPEINNVPKNSNFPNENLAEIDNYGNNAKNSEDEIPSSKRNKIFFMFLLANILLNYDTGVIPASLLQILKEIDLNFKEQALLGSLVYLGLSFASLFVGLIFAKYGPAKTCACAILINSLSCFLFSSSSQKLLLYFCRFLMGISEAFIVIYGPVWVNNYSPKEHSAKWMGILHSVTALGVMIGYVFAGIVINFFSGIFTWRFAIQIQGFAQIPVALFFFFEKEEYINVDLKTENYRNDNLNLNTISEIEDSVNHKTPGHTPQFSIANISKQEIRDDKELKDLKKISSSRFNSINLIDNINKINHDHPVRNIINDDKSNKNVFFENNTFNQNKNSIMNKNNNSNAYHSNSPLQYPQNHTLTQKISSNGNLQFNSNLNNINNDNYNTNNIPNTKSKVMFNTNQMNSNFPRIKKNQRIDAVETNNLRRYCNQVYQVVSNPLYISTTMSLCSIYFIVTGIQFWMTNYLIDILGNDPVLVIVIFSIVSITAPLGGVIVGGTFADAYGGYRGKNTLKALKLCSAFGVIAFVFAFPIGFLYSFIYIAVLLWTFLFFGAAIVPVATGIMVSSVRRDCQATSSSFSQLIFNTFGYFFAPILTGIIMDTFEDKVEGFKWGIRVIFWWSIFASIFMSLAWIIALRKYNKNSGEAKNLVLDTDVELNIDDLMKLEINRRMAQNKIL